LILLSILAEMQEVVFPFFGSSVKLLTCLVRNQRHIAVFAAVTATTIRVSRQRCIFSGLTGWSINVLAPFDCTRRAG
jgi:hypothetical protein